MLMGRKKELPPAERRVLVGGIQHAVREVDGEYAGLFCGIAVKAQVFVDGRIDCLACRAAKNTKYKRNPYSSGKTSKRKYLGV